MIYTILFVLSAIYNFFLWMKTVEYTFDIKKTIKHPYLISFLLSAPYSLLRIMETISQYYVYDIVLEVFVVVSRIIIIKILTGVDIKKDVIFVVFQYSVYTLCKPFAVLVTMLLSVSFHCSFDMISIIITLIQAPLSYYIALKSYFHVVDRYRLYVNKYFIITFLLLAFGSSFENIWSISFVFVAEIIFCLMTSYSIQNEQDKFQKSLAIQKEKNMIIEEYQEIEEEQLKLRKQKHDFQNHLYTIQVLLENNQRKEALEYIEKYIEKR